MNIAEQLFKEILKTVKKGIPQHLDKNVGVRTFIDDSTKKFGFKRITKEGIVP